MKNKNITHWFELQKKKMKPMGPIKKFIFKKLFSDVYLQGGIVR